MKQKKYFKHKVSGAILLESLVATVIISVVLTYASFSINNIFKGKNNYLKFKALIQLESVMEYNTDLENDSFDFKNFTINKSVFESELGRDLVEFEWKIVENKTKRVLGVIKEIKNKK